MNVDTLNACVEGYSERLFDQQLLSVHIGFWTGYFNNSKHPKSLNNILTSLIKKKDKSNQQHADSIDVEEYLRKEQTFKKRLNKE